MEVNSLETGTIATKEPQPVPEMVRGGRSRKRNMIVFVVICAFNVALLIVIGTQLLTPANPGQGSSNAAVAIGEIDTPLVGKPAPAFTLPRLDDESSQISLASLKGKPVMLNFWASWCDPCNSEAPTLQKSWLAQLQKQGVVLIGIDGAETSATNWRSFLQKYGITYLNVQDKTKGPTALDYGVTGFPETVFIDRQGLVVAKVIKPLSEQAIQFEIAKII